MKTPAKIASMAFVGVVAFVAVQLNAKLKYDRFRISEEERIPIVELDSKLRDVVHEIEKTWQLRTDDVNEQEAELFRLIGFDHSVDGMMELLSYRIPSYSWFDQERNLANTTIGFVSKAFSTTKTIDGVYFLSRDPKMIVIRPTEDSLLLYKESPNGLREVVYTRPYEIEPTDGSNDG